MVWTASPLHIYMLSFCCSPIEHVIVASVDACSKMVQRFPRWPFSRVARWELFFGFNRQFYITVESGPMICPQLLSICLDALLTGVPST